MQFLWSYLRQKRKEIGIFILFLFIFLLTFYLYHLPLRAVLYPTILCVFFGAVFLFADGMRMYGRHRLLERLASLSWEVLDELPAGETLVEQDYLALARSLEEQLRQMDGQHSRERADMVDYYTTWVHQIKTPIASMRLQLQNEDSALSRRLQEDLSRIEQYVEMVLCYLRLDADSTDYVLRETDLDDVVRPAVKKFAGQFISRKLRLVYEPLCLRVLTDEKWLQFMVEQVISNALKYTPSGEIQIYLEKEDMEGTDTLCIRDTGIGIAPEDLPRIFDKGYTGYNGRTDKKASGLGLYLCYRICKNLGHQISARSVPGEGTTVQIRFGRERLEVE